MFGFFGRYLCVTNSKTKDILVKLVNSALALLKSRVIKFCCLLNPDISQKCQTSIFLPLLTWKYIWKSWKSVFRLFRPKYFEEYHKMTLSYPDDFEIYEGNSRRRLKIYGFQNVWFRFNPTLLLGNFFSNFQPTVILYIYIANPTTIATYRIQYMDNSSFLCIPDMLHLYN